MNNKFFYILSFIGVALIFYFSWLPNPSLSESGLIPSWISIWSDKGANMNFRTAVPLFFLGILCSIWLQTKKTFYWWVLVWAGLATTVLMAELGQLLLPYRHFDWGDVWWGCAGAFIGMCPLGLLRLLYFIKKI